MYRDYHDVLSEKAEFLLKLKPDDRYFRYYSLKSVIKMLEKGMELYSLNHELQLRKFVSVTERGLQKFNEVTTFKGSKLWIGSSMQMFIDTFWLPLPEVEFHEHLYEYDFNFNYFFQTYITNIKAIEKRHWAFTLTTEDDSGYITNNLIIRTPNEALLQDEKTAWERANEEVLLLGGQPTLKT